MVRLPDMCIMVISRNVGTVGEAIVREIEVYLYYVRLGDVVEDGSFFVSCYLVFILANLLSCYPKI